MLNLFIFLCDTFPRLLCLQQDVKWIEYFDKTNKIIIGHFCTTYIIFLSATLVPIVLEM